METRRKCIRSDYCSPLETLQLMNGVGRLCYILVDDTHRPTERALRELYFHEMNIRFLFTSEKTEGNRRKCRTR